MKKEYVQELNEISNKLGIYPPLYRTIVAFAIAFNRNTNNYPSDDEVYNITKNALYNIDIEYLKNVPKYEFSYRTYAKELVLKTMEEMGIKQNTNKL